MLVPLYGELRPVPILTEEHLRVLGQLQKGKIPEEHSVIEELAAAGLVNYGAKN